MASLSTITFKILCFSLSLTAVCDLGRANTEELILGLDPKDSAKIECLPKQKRLRHSSQVFYMDEDYSAPTQVLFMPSEQSYSISSELKVVGDKQCSFSFEFEIGDAVFKEFPTAELIMFFGENVGADGIPVNGSEVVQFFDSCTRQ